MQIYRLEDIPLIYASLKELNLSSLIDSSIPTHKNRCGISLGELVTIWLCYLLSEGDHRLSTVEFWVEKNIVWLRSMSELPFLTSKDFTDDRLENALDYLGDWENWTNFSKLFEGNSLSLYDLDSDTIRLDAAPMQGHHSIQEGGLFQNGYTKHHKKLGQFKVMLATLDNAVNHFGYPLFHKVFPGDKADDVLYSPVIEECACLFSRISPNNSKLMVGDSKMGSKFLRNQIKSLGHYYLVPLSKIQLSAKRRKELIMSLSSSDYEQVYKEGKKGNLELVAQGFETIQTVEYYDKETKESKKWEERVIFVLSTNYAKSQQSNFEKKLKQIQEEILDLTIAKQGKKRIETLQEFQEEIQTLLSAKKMEDYLDVEVEQSIEIKQKRKYGNRPASREEHITFQINIQENKQAITLKKQTMGWQVYACLAPKEKLSLEQCVWKYRGQHQIENRFDNLRNKIAPLLPINLRKDNRVEALVHLLMIALKIISLMEYKVAKNLKQADEKLTNIYPGNPKQGTKTPTAKRMLTAFKGIHLVIFKPSKNGACRVEMTPLNKTQNKIIGLTNFKSAIYDEICHRIRISFST